MDIRRDREAGLRLRFAQAAPDTLCPKNLENHAWLRHGSPSGRSVVLARILL